MNNIALCKCGVDMIDHPDADPFDPFPSDEPVLGHHFDAAGTRHRCLEFIDGYLCPRPKYHHDEGIPCGPLTGDKLW